MKIITVSEKTTAQKSRIGTTQAAELVSAGTHHFCKKGAFKRQENDKEKAANKAKKEQVFGAAIMRRNSEIMIAKVKMIEKLKRKKEMKAKFNSQTLP